MRPYAVRIAFVLLLCLTGGLAAQDFFLPDVPFDASLPQAVAQRQEYFAKIGTAKGSGFKQYARQLEFIKPRLFPADEPVNFAALTWAHHYRSIRSPEYQAAKAAAAAASLVANWRPVEPTERQEGEDAGRINALAFEPGAPSTVYAATPAGGLWRTRDDGASWVSLTDSLPMLAVTDIAIDPTNPRTIYILTGDGDGAYDGRNSFSVGVLKSVDGGESWNATGLTWRLNQVQVGHRLIIHPTTPSILIAATTAGLLRTSDGGATWTTVMPATAAGGNRFWDAHFHPTDPSVVYAATQTTVYRSLDAGLTWAPLAGGLPTPTTRTSTRIRMAVSPAAPDTLYVLYASPTGFTIGLYRSDDRGNSFVRRSYSNAPPSDRDPTPPFDLSKPNILHEANNFNGRQAHYDLAIAVSPSNIDRVHVGGLDTWRSDDGGRTWKITSEWRAPPGSPNYTHADIHTLAYRGETLFTGTDGGVFQSDDGGEAWKSITGAALGGAIRQIYSVCITPQDPNLLLYGSQDNGTWRLQTDGPLKRVLGGDGMVCQIDPSNPDRVYASVQFGALYRSEDSGQNFNTGPPLQPPAAGIGAWVTPYALGIDDPENLYACYVDLWLGPDGGLGDWKNLTRGAIGSSNQCRQLVIAPSDPKTIYVAKAGDWRSWRRPGQGPWPPFLGGGGVFRSTDGGATWQTVTGALPVSDVEIMSLAVSPTDAQRVWVIFSGYKADAKVFATTDGGATWTNLSAGLPNLHAGAVAALDNPAHGVFIGNDAGVFYRDDRLGQWVPFTDGMPSVIVSALAIDETRKRLFAGTYGRGVWVSDIPAPCQSNCPPRLPPGGAQALPGAAQRPAGYVGPVEAFE